MGKNLVICPGCRVAIRSESYDLDKKFNASLSCLKLYYELSYFTLSLQDEDFIHQLIVDTYAAQHFGINTKPITITFALVGLYLVNERHYTGKHVQQVHIDLANKSQKWPKFKLDNKSANINVLDILNCPDNKKPHLIKEWSKSVWLTWKHEKEKVSCLLNKYQV